MTKFKVKNLIPLLFVVMGLVFAILGFTQLGFWSDVDGPKPGFFPSIIAIVMVFTGLIAFIQSFKEEDKAQYNAQEFLAMAGGLGIFAATFIIGLVPTIILYIILWLKLVEKASWKVILIVLAIACFITIGVFGIWLGIQFPKGIFEFIL
ncbi:MAG TPA: tripartite tricarboxylate transporter TctB family protein [Defluviitaleaceae bacterium]|jgi:hypothetical protein|nr:tripartite tricarboxylate transporter TctB family protein [Candidatus Epulonipiscium sp.]HOQ17318.1 tripartite tricarboxylate transporter TctB family protein [Defluviitaleaceae bacterium]HPT76389.1 tripartite tricarboxylate transporter TctB family protein [Defluviitaleaceae bacterium]HQD49620.1 tripartite tricarboxylate transporter TctB family protein [Defluviitaleaceae bacterium]